MLRLPYQPLATGVGVQIVKLGLPTGRTKRRLSANSALCKNRGKHAAFGKAKAF